MAATKQPITKTPASTEEPKTIKLARERYEKDKNSALRQMDYYTTKKVLKNEKLTWAEFCDIKVKAHTEFWTLKKSNPGAGARTQKPIDDPAVLQKKKEEYEKMKAKMAKAEALIKSSEALIAKK